MVRTAASQVKVSGGKAAKAVGKSTGGSQRPEKASSSKSGYSRLNPICHRETPAWQKPITHFFARPENMDDSCSSGADYDQLPSTSAVAPAEDVSCVPTVVALDKINTTTVQCVE